MSAAKNPYPDPYDEETPPGSPLDDSPRTPRLSSLLAGTDPLSSKWIPADAAAGIVERFERGEASWNETIAALEEIALDQLPTGAQLLEELE